MHVGGKSVTCPDNFIDTWTLQSKKEKISSVWDLEDVESGQHCMEKVSEWKYLGDVISSDAKCDSNVKARVIRGIGAATQIIQMLSDLCLGKYYFQSAIREHGHMSTCYFGPLRTRYLLRHTYIIL